VERGELLRERRGESFPTLRQEENREFEWCFLSPSPQAGRGGFEETGERKNEMISTPPNLSPQVERGFRLRNRGEENGC